MKKEQMRELTKEELLQRRSEIEEELFNLRIQKASKELDNPLRLRMLKREIARVNTILREDELKIKPLVLGEKKVDSTGEKQE
jgi:large subunit ribosomal protein L29